MNTPNNRTPREVHAALLKGIADKQFHTLAELYAADAVVDLPLAIPQPRRLQGREEIDRHFHQAANSPISIEVGRDVVVFETTDPEVIVAEFGYTGRVKATGRTVQVANVQIMRVREGQIVQSRDYHDHAAITAVLAEG